jgi:hypothetical protein
MRLPLRHLMGILAILLVPMAAEGGPGGPGGGGRRGGGGGNPTGYRKPLSIPHATPYRFVGLQEVTAWRVSQALVTFADMQSAENVSVLYPGRRGGSEDVVPDPNVLDLLKALKPGDIVEITGTDVDEHHVLTAIVRYKPKPGEDEPGVFVFKRQTTLKVDTAAYAAVALCKLAEMGTLLLPHAKDSKGRLVPDAALTEAVGAFKEGDLVVVQFDTVGASRILRSIEAYTAPLQAEFARYTPKGKDDKSCATVEVKTDSGSQTLRIPNYRNADGYSFADRAITAVASKLNPGDLVQYRLRGTDSSAALSLLRPCPKQPAKVAKTDKTEKTETPAKAE